MTVIEFLEYLEAREATRHLAHELAEVWVAHELYGRRLEPAA